MEPANLAIALFLQMDEESRITYLEHLQAVADTRVLAPAVLESAS